MEDLILLVADTSHDPEPTINVKCEITHDELARLNSAFKVCGLYHSITQIKDIVVENGESFLHFMAPSNLSNLKEKNISSEKAIMLANKAVLNYESSIKTYIDMEKRLLVKNATKEDVEMFENLQHVFYDSHAEYRFWINFRNYIVHCAFPYTIYRETEGQECQIICSKEHLLEFDNWKHVKPDIMELDEHIDLTAFVESMSAMIVAFHLDFFTHFALTIMGGIEIYGEFCRNMMLVHQ